MKNPEINGEFDLIASLTGDFPLFHEVYAGIGDDAAVIRKPDGSFRLYALDTLVENDHFNREWSTPEAVGQKAVEVNVSDIAAMGGEPEFALVSLVLSPDVPFEWTRRLYYGIRTTCEKYGISLIGGDTTHGNEVSLSVTLTGRAENDMLCLRSGAKAGDLICITGQAGGSAAGYFSLRKGLKIGPYLQKRHLSPVARLEASRVIAPHASAMIDVSDGVASETKHIARQSGLGAIVHAEKLPVHPDVFAAEARLKLPKYTCALSGGEDFELLFTLAPERQDALRTLFADFTVIGEMTVNSAEYLFLEGGRARPLPDGFDHLRPL